MKTHCPKCGDPLTEENYNPNNAKRKVYKCTPCLSAIQKAAREKKKDHYSAYQSKYHRDNLEARQDKNARYRAENQPQIKKTNKEYRSSEHGRNKAVDYKTDVKIKVFSHYCGGEIRCKCGCTDMRSLTVDHINGGGEKHRKTINVSGSYHMCLWLRKNEYPEGYQILCMNCQWEKSHVGTTNHYRNRIKNMVFAFYSNNTMKCGCGYSDMRALSIDHIHGDGNNDRRGLIANISHRDVTKPSTGGHVQYAKLKRDNFPDGYQVLCMNCQFIKRYTNNEHNQYKKQVPVSFDTGTC